jgi:DNA-binding response OmpR family regulator
MSIVRRSERIARCNRYGRDQTTLAVLPIRERAERKLEFGADGYVTKPCSPGEVLAHVRTVMRRLIYSRSDCPTAVAIELHSEDLNNAEHAHLTGCSGYNVLAFCGLTTRSERCSGLHGTD